MISNDLEAPGHVVIYHRGPDDRRAEGNPYPTFHREVWARRMGIIHRNGVNTIHWGVEG